MTQRTCPECDHGWSNHDRSGGDEIGCTASAGGHPDQICGCTQIVPPVQRERCPQCGSGMERVTIDGHASYACPVDAYAYAIDQDDDE